VRLLVTRPASDAQITADRLVRRGHHAIVAPVIKIRTCNCMIPHADWQAVLITSANALHALKKCDDLTDLRGRPVLAVGEASAEAARSAGFASVTSADGAADDLVALIRERLDPAAGPLLHLRGRHVAHDLGAELQHEGYAVTGLVVYEAVAAASLPESAATALLEGTADGVLAFSPRSARVFGKLARAAGLADRAQAIIWFCMSPAVAEAARMQGADDIVVASYPVEEALFEAIDKRAR
jgi:uroporphyrinogen-III synthase